MKDDGPRETVSLLREAAPLLRHAVIVAIQLACLTLFGLVLRQLHAVFPDHLQVIVFLEQIDLWLVAALLCLFAIYTFVIVALRMWVALRSEIAHAKRAQVV